MMMVMVMVMVLVIVAVVVVVEKNVDTYHVSCWCPGKISVYFLGGTFG